MSLTSVMGHFRPTATPARGTFSSICELVWTYLVGPLHDIKFSRRQLAEGQNRGPRDKSAIVIRPRGRRCDFQSASGFSSAFAYGGVFRGHACRFGRQELDCKNYFSSLVRQDRKLIWRS